MAGERSYWQLSELQQNIESVQTDLDALHANKNDIEQKVVMMRPGSINRDLLDERVRAVLGYRPADEVVVMQ